jgi:hypothetical protein
MCGRTSCPDIVARLIVRANDRSAARTRMSDPGGAGAYVLLKPKTVSKTKTVSVHFSAAEK